MKRLEELEYVLVHAGPRGKSLVYELLYETPSEEGAPCFPGLVDAATLDQPLGYDRESFVPGPESSARIPPRFCVDSALIPEGTNSPKTRSLSTFLSSLEAEEETSLEKARRGAKSPADPVVPKGANGSRDPSAGEE